MVIAWIEDLLWQAFKDMPLIPLSISCFVVLSVYLLREISLHSPYAISPVDVVEKYVRQLYMIVLFISVPVMTLLLFIHLFIMNVSSMLGPSAQNFHHFVLLSSLALFLFGVYLKSQSGANKSITPNTIYGGPSRIAPQEQIDDPFVGLAYPLLQIGTHALIVWVLANKEPQSSSIQRSPSSAWRYTSNIILLFSMFLLLVKLRSCARVLQEDIHSEEEQVEIREEDEPEGEQSQGFLYNKIQAISSNDTRDDLWGHSADNEYKTDFQVVKPTTVRTNMIRFNSQ